MHAVDASDVAVADLATNPNVAGIEGDGIRRVQAAPSDPEYSNQWALSRISWDQARNEFFPLGSSTVAVLDTGVDASHPALAGRLVPGAAMICWSDRQTE